jgi:hypothetical protein
LKREREEEAASEEAQTAAAMARAPVVVDVVFTHAFPSFELLSFLCGLCVEWEEIR